MLHLAKQRDTDHVSGGGEDEKFSPHACLVMFARRTAVSTCAAARSVVGKLQHCVNPTCFGFKSSNVHP